jgi:hypothetical protein
MVESAYGAWLAAWHMVQWQRTRPRKGPATTTAAFPQEQVQRTSLIVQRARANEYHEPMVLDFNPP